MKTILILTVSIFLAGCHGLNFNHNQVNFAKDTGNAGEDLTITWNELLSIGSAGLLNDAQKGHVESAKSAVKLAQGHLAKATQDYAQLATDWTWYHGFWQTWNNAWLGPRTWRLIYWAAGITVALGVLYVVSLAEGAGGWLGAVAGAVWWIFHTATGFIFVGLAKLRDWLKAWATRRGSGIGGMVPA